MNILSTASVFISLVCVSIPAAAQSVPEPPSDLNSLTPQVRQAYERALLDTPENTWLAMPPATRCAHNEHLVSLARTRESAAERQVRVEEDSLGANPGVSDSDRKFIRTTIGAVDFSRLDSMREGFAALRTLQDPAHVHGMKLFTARRIAVDAGKSVAMRLDASRKWQCGHR
jgi:hypothetical protein